MQASCHHSSNALKERTKKNKKRDQSRPGCGYRRRAGGGREGGREGKRDRTDSDGARAPGLAMSREHECVWVWVTARPRQANGRASVRSRSLMAREARSPNRTVTDDVSRSRVALRRETLPAEARRRPVPSRASSDPCRCRWLAAACTPPPSRRRRPVLSNRLSIGRPPARGVAVARLLRPCARGACL